MAYCGNCGTYQEEGIKFCTNCGASLQIHKTTRQEYVGKLIKCPACGAEIPSLKAFCPSCGHEINSAKVSSSIKEFSEQISKCDIAIANSNTDPKHGWSSWGKYQKIGWVILNLFTFFIPLIVYLLFPLLGIGGVIALTPKEKIKVQFINNYSFPNDRESILEGLLYIKSQVRILVDGKIDRNTYRWAKIWKNKASQLFDKAEIMLKEDSVAKSTYADIVEGEKRVKSILVRRLLIGIIVVGIYSLFIFHFRGSDLGINLPGSYKWPRTGIAEHVPEPPSNRGEITFNDDENLWLQVRGIDRGEYDEYINECKERGFVIDNEKDSISYEAYNQEGYYLQLIYTGYDSELDIRVEAPKEMGTIQWPKSDLAKRLPVPKSNYGRIEWEEAYGFVMYLGNTSIKDFNEYADACYDSGFTVDYSRGDTYYYADDEEGYHIDLRYEGYNTMFLRLDAPGYY